MNNTLSDVNLLRIDEHLRTINWPGLQKIETPSVEAGDFLLVCAGFEDRAIESLRRTCESGKKDFSLGIVDYRPINKANKKTELYEIAQSAKLAPHKLIYDRENPTGIGEKLTRLLEEQAAKRVFVDISGMSRLLIVQVLVALINENEQYRPIKIIYGEAEAYSPSEEEFKQDHIDAKNRPETSYLSSGILEIAITPELSSVAMLGEAIRLIAFPSLDHIQFTNLIEQLQPTYVEVIDGIPPDVRNRWRTDAIRELNKTTLKMLKNHAKHEACTLDYSVTLDILLKIYKEHNVFNRLLIAPTGSKMQTVAVGLFRAALQDIQIVYPTPKISDSDSEKYTDGLSRLYEVELPVEKIFEKR